MNRKGWKQISCGCCAGLMWGGEYPRECKRCGGLGSLFLHLSSGTLAEYPGGPLLGRLTESERQYSASKASRCRIR